MEKNIENSIREKLRGETQKNALDFVALAQANGLSPVFHQEGCWVVGGTPEQRTGLIFIHGDEVKFGPPVPWVVWFTSCDFIDNGSVDDGLKEFAWAHASPCGKCRGDDWEKCNKGERIIFTKNVGRLCHCPLIFCEPDGTKLEQIIKLQLLLQPQQPSNN